MKRSNVQYPCLELVLFTYSGLGKAQRWFSGHIEKRQRSRDIECNYKSRSGAKVLMECENWVEGYFGSVIVLWKCVGQICGAWRTSHRAHGVDVALFPKGSKYNLVSASFVLLIVELKWEVGHESKINSVTCEFLFTRVGAWNMQVYRQRLQLQTASLCWCFVQTASPDTSILLLEQCLSFSERSR